MASGTAGGHDAATVPDTTAVGVGVRGGADARVGAGIDARPGGGHRHSRRRRLHRGRRARDGDGDDSRAHDRADAEEAMSDAVRAGIFVIPTLTVTESLLDMGGGAELAADPRVAPLLTPAQGGGLRSGFGGAPSPDAMRGVLDRVGALHAAGVPLLAGSDAPNPGTAHGASVHREIELLVRAGLSPVEALRAATAAPADAFGLDDRGRIAPGMKADLVLVRPRDGGRAGDARPRGHLEGRRARRARPSRGGAGRPSPDRPPPADRLRGCDPRRPRRLGVDPVDRYDVSAAARASTCASPRTARTGTAARSSSAARSRPGSPRRGPVS